MKTKVIIRWWQKVLMIIISVIIICLVMYLIVYREHKKIKEKIEKQQITQILKEEKWVLYSKKMELD